MRARARLALAGMLALMAGGALAFDFDSAAVEAGCAEEWPDDEAMQERCYANQLTGFETLTGLVQGEQDAVMVAALERCAAEWRGDWSMAGYCAQEQVAGRAALERTLEELPGAVGAEILAACDSHWADDYRMRAHCVARDAADWRETN